MAQTDEYTNRIAVATRPSDSNVIRLLEVDRLWHCYGARYIATEKLDGTQIMFDYLLDPNTNAWTCDGGFSHAEKRVFYVINKKLAVCDDKHQGCKGFPGVLLKEINKQEEWLNSSSNDIVAKAKKHVRIYCEFLQPSAGQMVPKKYEQSRLNAFYPFEIWIDMGTEYDAGKAVRAPFPSLHAVPVICEGTFTQDEFVQMCERRIDDTMEGLIVYFPDGYVDDESKRHLPSAFKLRSGVAETIDTQNLPPSRETRALQDMHCSGRIVKDKSLNIILLKCVEECDMREEARECLNSGNEQRLHEMKMEFADAFRVRALKENITADKKRISRFLKKIGTSAMFRL